MDRYTQACMILESAYAHIKNMAHQISQLEELKEIRQHLTPSYGKERVSSSPSNDNPAQLALERYEERKLEISKRIAESSDIIEKAQKYVAMLGNTEQRDILDMHYLSGWSFGKIAQKKGCSIRTVSRGHKFAMLRLKGILENKKEAEA